MSDKTETRKRILFLWFLLGTMAGIAIYLAYKALASGTWVLLVALLPMAIAAIPIGKSLRELRGGRTGEIVGEQASRGP